MKILLAYDGSENAKRALGRAIGLSDDLDAEFVIAYRVDLEAFETFAAKHLLAELLAIGWLWMPRISSPMHLSLPRKAGSQMFVPWFYRMETPPTRFSQQPSEKRRELIVVGRRG